MRKISVEQLVEVKVFSLWFDLHKIFWAIIKGELYSMSEFSYHQQGIVLLRQKKEVGKLLNF